MKKLAILSLTMLLACLSTAMRADSQKEPRDDSRYLAGAVPTVDGKVVFSKTFQLPGKSEQQVYDLVAQWMDKRLKDNKNAGSRVVYKDEAKGTIAGVGEEWVVFSSSALALDRTWMSYQITATCTAGNCVLNLEKIRYTYRETEKYRAEEWITDEYALNKAKTKLVRGLAKWRRKTVDFADALFANAATAFGTTTTVGIVPVAPAQLPSTLTPIDLKQIPGEVYALMGSGKLVISIGEDEFNMTNMTANAGGALGYQNGKAVAYCTLAPDQPYDAIEKADTYTLKIYATGQTTPSAIIECKKLPSQTAPQAGQPRTYVGEIVKMSARR